MKSRDDVVEDDRAATGQVTPGMSRWLMLRRECSTTVEFTENRQCPPPLWGNARLAGHGNRMPLTVDAHTQWRRTESREQSWYVSETVEVRLDLTFQRDVELGRRELFGSDDGGLLA